MKLFAAALAASLLAIPVAGIAQTPTPIKGILAAQRFTLAEPYRDTWALDKSTISAGTLLVLDVDPKLVAPRESLNPVLYVGGKPTMKLNNGDMSGHVLVIVPASIDVARAQIWFSAPDLPEALTTAKVNTEKLRAERAFATQGAVATQSSRAAALPQRAAVQATNLAALLRDAAAPLIDEFSPQDKDVAAMWRLPEGG